MPNCRHLHCCWIVTREGGFALAAECLDMAAQTLSAQTRQLEKERWSISCSSRPGAGWQ